MLNRASLQYKELEWFEELRPKATSVVSFEGQTYVNTSGKNSIPTLLIDWVLQPKANDSNTGESVLEGTFIDSTIFNTLLGVAYIPGISKVYIDTTTNITYRWNGTNYIPIGSSLALGESPLSAYRGDRGKTAFDEATKIINSAIQFLVGQIVRLRIIWFGGFTIAERNAIISPQEGMLIFVNQSPKGFQKFEDGAWLSIGVNISNANLTNLTTRTFTLNASFTWVTLGNPFRITGLINSLEPDKALVLNAAKEIREVQIINLAELYTGVTYPTNQFLIDNYPLAEIVKCPNTPIPRQYTKLGLVWAHFNLTPA